MQITLYPNNELRARIVTPPKVKKGGSSSVKMAGPLNLSIVEKLRQESEDIFRPEKIRPELRPGYGGKPQLRDFSHYGRRRIVRAGALIGVEEKRECTLFLTGTLPGGTDEALKSISDYSAWIVHELLTVIPRLGQVKSADCKIIWVWEWQKRGALHWHAVCEFPTREAAKAVFLGFKGLWIRVLESVGERVGIDIAARRDAGTHAGDYGTWRTRAEWARKNPSRYMAKYVAKGPSPVGLQNKFPPSRWYGISRSLHRELREETIVALTSFVTNVPDYRVGGDYDLNLIERFFSKSHTTRFFPDKIRDGFTFVFYVNDEDRNEIEELMRGIRGIQDMKSKNPNKLATRRRYHYLEVIPKYLRANSRFLGSIGSFAQDLLEVWYEGEEVPDYELQFLDNFAAECLINEGCIERVIPPERSGAGLTGQGTVRIDQASPPTPSFDQPSLFP